MSNRAIRVPPPVSDYNFVLRLRSGRNPEIPIAVPGYDENTQSRDITHHDGLRMPTVFVRSHYFAQRLRCMGWEDVTKSWAQGNWPNGSADADTDANDDLLERATELLDGEVIKTEG